MNKANKWFSMLLEPFKSGERFDIGLLLVFLGINGLVLINAGLHDPRIGYDAGAHLNYINSLSKMSLVTPADTDEFFSPPLPYLIPALIIFITHIKLVWAAKLAQLLNVFLSIGLTYCLVKSCQLLCDKPTLKFGALAFLGILPVYYKTFAFVRGEPYVAFFAMVVLYYTLLVFIRKQFTTLNSTILGVSMGLCALSRQWGVLLFPSMLLLFAFQWIRLHEWRYSIAKTACICLALIFLVSGWFYASLFFRYGSVTAFNRESASHFSLRNQPLQFYLGLSPKLLFSEPVRPNFSNQLLPIFYSDVWGDYWGYFIVYGKDIRTSKFVNGSSLNNMLSVGEFPSWLDTNYQTIRAYLGRVNFVSLYPSVLALISFLMVTIGVLRGRSELIIVQSHRGIFAFLLLTISTMLLGYFWFLIMYPSMEEGDTIKASYVLHVFPFVAIIVGVFLHHIETVSQSLLKVLLSGFLLTVIHNICAMLTHYSLFKLF
jgi:hypothetical protein